MFKSKTIETSVQKRLNGAVSRKTVFTRESRTLLFQDSLGLLILSRSVLSATIVRPRNMQERNLGRLDRNELIIELPVNRKSTAKQTSRVD